MDGEKSLEESITNLKEDGGLHAGCNLQSNAAFRSREEDVRIEMCIPLCVTRRSVVRLLDL
jgi:hypothetical protein